MKADEEPALASAAALDVSHLQLDKGNSLIAELSKARCLNLCEVRLILIDQLRGSNKRSPQASTIMQQAYEYSAGFAQIKVRQAVLDVRNVLENQADLVEYEIACLINLFPKTPEEAKKLVINKSTNLFDQLLIPSLSRLSDVSLNSILDELDTYRIFTA